MVMVSRPCLTIADVFSGSSLQGSAKLRANLVVGRSCRCVDYPFGTSAVTTRLLPTSSRLTRGQVESP